MFQYKNFKKLKTCKLTLIPDVHFLDLEAMTDTSLQYNLKKTHLEMALRKEL